MAETLSTMLPLGTYAPEFSLTDVTKNKVVSLSDLQSDKATVIMFICNHCPYVKHIQKKLVEVAKEYQQKGVAFIAISSNDIKKYPTDDLAHMKSQAEEYHFSFPYLYDETQEVAKAYHAACTPDFFVFDANRECVYRGRFDEATLGNGKPITGKDLTNALDALLSNKTVPQEQFPSMGCNIKWF